MSVQCIFYASLCLNYLLYYVWRIFDGCKQFTFEVQFHFFISELPLGVHTHHFIIMILLPCKNCSIWRLTFRARWPFFLIFHRLALNIVFSYPQILVLIFHFPRCVLWLNQGWQSSWDCVCFVKSVIDWLWWWLDVSFSALSNWHKHLHLRDKTSDTKIETKAFINE